jgi:hypothetical protein
MSNLIVAIGWYVTCPQDLVLLPVTTLWLKGKHENGSGYFLNLGEGLL